MSVINLPYDSNPLLGRTSATLVPDPSQFGLQEKPSRKFFETPDTTYVSHQNITLNPDSPNKIRHHNKSVPPRDPSQALRNAKAFYKRYLEAEVKSRRMKLMASRQKRKSNETPELREKNQTHYINQLAEANLKLFKNMNRLAIGETSPIKANDTTFGNTKEDNGIIRPSIRCESVKNKKAKFNLLNAKRTSIFIPTSYSFAVDDGSSFNFPGEVSPEPREESRDNSPMRNRNELKPIDQSPNMYLKQKYQNRFPLGQERVRRNNEPYMNMGINRKRGEIMGQLMPVEMDNSQNPVVLPKILPNYQSVSVQDKSVFKMTSAVHQNIAGIYHEKLPINKHTLGLMGKLARNGVNGVIKERPESKVNNELVKNGRMIVEKSRRSASMAI